MVSRHVSEWLNHMIDGDRVRDILRVDDLFSFLDYAAVFDSLHGVFLLKLVDTSRSGTHIDSRCEGVLSS